MSDATRVCTGCKETKPLSDYYRDRGRTYARCKACHNARMAVWHDDNRDRCNEKRKASYRANLAHQRERKRAGKKVERHQPGWKERRDAIRESHPEAWRAWASVQNAIRSGRLVRPHVCGRCGASDRIEAHHHDYSKPLDVEFLCPTCHKGADKQRRSA